MLCTLLSNNTRLYTLQAKFQKEIAMLQDLPLDRHLYTSDFFLKTTKSCSLMNSKNKVNTQTNRFSFIQ